MHVLHCPCQIYSKWLQIPLVMSYFRVTLLNRASLNPGIGRFLNSSMPWYTWNNAIYIPESRIPPGSQPRMSHRLQCFVAVVSPAFPGSEGLRCTRINIDQGPNTENMGSIFGDRNRGTRSPKRGWKPIIKSTGPCDAPAWLRDILR